MFLQSSFRAAQKFCISDRASYNKTLTRLRRALARKRKKKILGERIHPMIEMVISKFAREFAAVDHAKVSPKHIEMAAQKALTILKPRRGRPDDEMLDLHVAGLVALIQETSGSPVIARKTRNSVYEPHFGEGASQLVPIVFRDVDASISNTRLINSVRKVRKKYAGKPLRFRNLFPFYGGSVTSKGEIRMPPGYRLISFTPNIPIYCP